MTIDHATLHCFKDIQYCLKNLTSFWTFCSEARCDPHSKAYSDGSMSLEDLGRLLYWVIFNFCLVFSFFFALNLLHDCLLLFSLACLFNLLVCLKRRLIKNMINSKVISGQETLIVRWKVVGRHKKNQRLRIFEL